MQQNESLVAKVARPISAKQNRYVFVQPVSVHGGVSSEPLGLRRWLSTLPGHEDDVVVFQDEAGAWIFHGPIDEKEMKEFEPLSELDWWQETIYRK